jgi:hypothetical protein
MSQILKLKRGNLERISIVTGSLTKGEMIIASSSANINSINGSSIVFSTTENGRIEAVNRIIKSNTAPNIFSSSVYGNTIDGVPYFDSGSGTLYLLGADGNEAISLIGNIQPLSSSVNTRISQLESFSSSLTTTFATDIELAAVSQSVSASEAAVSASIANSLSNIYTFFPAGVISSSQQVIDIFNANFSSSMAVTVDQTFATDYEVEVTSSLMDGGEW